MGQSERPKLTEVIRPWLTLPREQLIVRVAGAIDAAIDAGAHQDDITMVVMDV